MGCGAGADADLLRRLGGTELHGIEPVAEAAEEARRRYDDVFNGSVEDWSWDGKPYDLIVFADVLEHLVDPYTLLRESRAWLSDTGRILVSIPNIRHLSVLWGLVIGGDWRYGQHGIMDGTHLRFFTSRSFDRALHEAGYEPLASHRWGGMRLTRMLAEVAPPVGEFLLSLIFVLARPARP